MATLLPFTKPTTFSCPVRTIHQRSSDETSYVKRVNTGSTSFTTFEIGRLFEKTIVIPKSQNGRIVKVEVKIPMHLECFVYAPISNSERTFFTLGSDAEQLRKEVSSFFNCRELNEETVNVRELERRALNSGTVFVISLNRFTQTENIIRKKTDGTVYREGEIEPDLNDREKYVGLKVPILERSVNIRVYDSGKMTKYGREDSDHNDFILLKQAYDTLKTL